MSWQCSALIPVEVQSAFLAPVGRHHRPCRTSVTEASSRKPLRDFHRRQRLRDSHDQHRQLEAAGWRDAWIERNPRRRPPGTWFSPKYDNPFRLDHALLSPDAPRSRHVDYPSAIDGQNVLGRGGLSDHLPVVVKL